MDEFKQLDVMLQECYWRVPVALVAVISLCYFLATTLNVIDDEPEPRQQGCKRPAPQSNTSVARPFPFHIFRCLAMLCAARFAWIYFANKTDPAYFIGHIEALAWMVWNFGLLPLWLWEEKELYNMRSSSGPKS